MRVVVRRRVMLAIAAAAATASCGRLDFDGSGHADAPARDDGAIDARPCSGTTHTITDNFDDNTRDTQLWGNAYSDNLSTYAETGGRVEITLGSNSTNDWAGYVTSTSYELADDRVFVEVLQITTGAATNTVLIAATSVTVTDGPSIESEEGRLRFRERIGGQIFDRGSVPYSATEHRWWQIRERAGTTYWELSPDAIHWTIGYQEASAANTTVFVSLASGTNGTASASPGTAIFDNLNGGQTPPACP